jgi:hypothetical protein
MSKISDTAKARVQLSCLHAIYFGATIDLRQAIYELSLDHPKYENLARKEGLNTIADEIQKAIEDNNR